VVFFFFQAEDGIRDLTVTGVQTCALPILSVNEIGLQFDAGGVFADGGVDVSFLFERLGEIEMSLRVSGRKADGGLEMRNSFIKGFLLEADNPEMKMRGGQIGLEAERFRKFFCGLVVAGLLREEGAQLVVQ